MNQIYDFNAHTPPVMTARMLEQTCKRRRFERQMLLLSIAAALFELCALTAATYLAGVSLAYGLVCAAVLCVMQIGGGLVLIAFLKSNKSSLLSC